MALVANPPCSVCMKLSARDTVGANASPSIAINAIQVRLRKD